MIHPSDEVRLDWFFGRGQTMFAKSTTGTLLERAQMYNVPVPMTQERWEAMRDRRPNEPPVGELTVRSTATVRESHVVVPPEDDLAKYAWVAHRLARLELIEPGAVQVLAAYYGDLGARWGCTDMGRLFAVLPLTSAGREILRRNDERVARREIPDLGLIPTEKLRNEVILQRVRPRPAMGRLIDRARRQALSLHQVSCNLWVQVRGNPLAQGSNPDLVRRRASGRVVDSASAAVAAKDRSGS